MSDLLSQTLDHAALAAQDIRFAFFDVDGTIMNAAHEISNETKRALREFRGRGGNFGLASGRPYFGAMKILEQLEVSGISVFFSGALVVDPLSGTAFLEETLSPEEAAHVLEYARREELFVEVYTREGYFIDEPSRFADIHASYLGMRPQVRSLDTLIRSEPILKLEFVANSKSEEAKLHAFSKLTPQLNFGFGYGAAHPNILFTNVTSAAASRHKAFECVSKHLGLPAENIAAFGDAEADIPFLQLCGLGVAMGNAPQGVKDTADCVTKSVEEEGVAFVLDHLGPL